MAATFYDMPNKQCVGLAPCWSQDNVPDVPATGATAGAPGSWTPAGANVIPSNAAGATSAGIVANPTSAWTTGQYVQGSTTGTAGRMFWNGTAWTAGTAAAA